jgi:hypothetical protein
MAAARASSGAQNTLSNALALPVTAVSTSDPAVVPQKSRGKQPLLSIVPAVRTAAKRAHRFSATATRALRFVGFINNISILFDLSDLMPGIRLRDQPRLGYTLCRRRISPGPFPRQRRHRR